MSERKVLEDKIECSQNSGDECIHNNRNVTHITFTGTKKPDCIACDGYGADAEKYGWSCYFAKRNFGGRRGI
jgi:hypothetical protein